MNSRVIKCDGFIIPNAITLCGVNDSGNEADLFSGEKLTGTKLFVQMWFTNEVSENISRHEEYSHIGYICEDVELGLLNGKKEGDVISIKRTNELGEYELVVTLKQSGYRYEDFGSFDHVLDNLKQGEPNWKLVLEDYYSKDDLEKMFNDLIKNS